MNAPLRPETLSREKKAFNYSLIDALNKKELDFYENIITTLT